jgi:hypothetical protein
MTDSTLTIPSNSIVSQSTESHPQIQMQIDLKQLHDEGYVIWRNVVSPSDYSVAQDHVNPQKVNYKVLLRYINKRMLPVVNDKLGWNAVYTKCRISDNNNSTDASLFHRDAAMHNAEKRIFPLFTCLSYLDETSMEIIPRSHLYPVMSYGDALSAYTSSGRVQRLKINPGDIMIFHSGLIHRGIFSQGLGHRRLVQVFEVFPTPSLMNEYKDRILHIRNEKSRSIGSWAISLSKNESLLWFVNFFGYMNAATGYGYQHRPLQRCGLDYDYCSSEGTQERLKDIDEDGWGKTNVYVLTGNYPSIDRSESSLAFWQYECQSIVYAFLTLLLLVLVIWILMRLISNLIKSRE